MNSIIQGCGLSITADYSSLSLSSVNVLAGVPNPISQVPLKYGWSTYPYAHQHYQHQGHHHFLCDMLSTAL